MRTLLETRQLTQAQENECGQVTIGFGFTFYRLRDWGEFFFFPDQSQIEWRKSNPSSTGINFACSL